MNYINIKMSRLKTYWCVVYLFLRALVNIPVAAAALVPCSFTSIFIFCIIFETHSCSSAETDGEGASRRLNT